MRLGAQELRRRLSSAGGRRVPAAHSRPGPPFQDKTGDRRIESVGATPLMQTGTLVTVFAYMIVLQPVIGLFSLALFSLQIFFRAAAATCRQRIIRRRAFAINWHCIARQ